MDTISINDAKTDTTPRAQLFWVRQDGQGELDMSGMTPAAALVELLDQCGTDEDRAEILAGAFEAAAMAD